MKPILLNFLNVIRRFKLAALLNILGLSVAFAAFMVIMTQLDYDWGFDQFHKDSRRIFRLEFSMQNTTQAVICRPLAERFFASSPHIEAGALCNPWGGEVFVYVEQEGERNYYNEYAISVSPEFTDVFTFDFVEGAQEALKNPDQIIIPLSLAYKIFGKESAVGQQLFFRGGNMTVGAVYRDFPNNSVVNNYIYGPISENENKNDWGNWNYHIYLRVNDESNASLLIENFKRDFDPKTIWGEDFDWDQAGASLRLTALPDIHYVTDVQYDQTPKTSKPTLLVLLAIALVIVAIAAINFTNFSTALTPMRIKSINTQRVLGAQQSSIRLLLVSEAMISSLLSYLMAIFLILIFQRTPLAQLVDADLSLTAHPMIVGGTILVALFTGLLAGAWPARYITSFAPALVLKGSFGLSPKGRKLRNTLIGIQFIASFALFIGAFFMFLQNRFMQHSPLGYNKDELIVTNIGRIQDRRDTFTNQIKTYSGIEDVTYGEMLLSSSDQYMGWGRQYRGEQIQFQCLPVHYSFLKVLGIKITDGRDFRE